MNDTQPKETSPQQIVMNVILGAGILLALFAVSRYNFLLFHSIAEFFSITVAWSLFLLVWNLRAQIQNKAFVFLGTAYFFIGTIDFLHTISYKGMGVIAAEWGANPATQLWIAGRYLESLSLCLFVFLPFKRLRPSAVLLLYFSVTVFIFLAIFQWHIFPDCYREGLGLTAFKKGSEYLICLLLFAALMGLYLRKAYLEPFVYRLMAISIVLTIMGELAFTFYISVYGLSNMVGHFFKIVSFFLIYLALVRTGLQKPYRTLFRELKESEKKYKSLFQELDSAAALHEVICDAQGVPVDYRFVEINAAFEKMTGFKAAELIGKTVGEVLPKVEPFWIERYGDIAMSGKADSFESYSAHFQKYFEVRAYSTKSGQFVAIFSDITDKKKAEFEKDALIEELQSALQKVKTLKGLIPICANCKKIRDDQGYWNQLESYLRRHSDAEFSHGICPECEKKLYPELEEE